MVFLISSNLQPTAEVLILRVKKKSDFLVIDTAGKSERSNPVSSTIVTFAFNRSKSAN